jgi:hypothetical protein
MLQSVYLRKYSVDFKNRFVASLSQAWCRLADTLGVFRTRRVYYGTEKRNFQIPVASHDLQLLKIAILRKP